MFKAHFCLNTFSSQNSHVTLYFLLQVYHKLNTLHDMHCLQVTHRVTSMEVMTVHVGEAHVVTDAHVPFFSTKTAKNAFKEN